MQKFRKKYVIIKKIELFYRIKGALFMKVAIACDHGGFELKQEILGLLKDMNVEFEDFGSYDSCAVDYPDYAFKVSESVAAGQFDRGILICGTGIGISIAANKVKGIRCALVHDLFSAKAT